MEKQLEKKTSFKLPEKRIKVMPVLRQGSWLPKGHDGEFMFTGTSAPISVPINTRTGTLINPLTPEEQDTLEKILAKEPGDLSVYKSKNENFWAKYYVKLDKEGTILDLSNPDDFIKYKVLLINRELIAPSFEDRYSIPTSRWMLVEEEHEIQQAARQADLMQTVWMEFGSMKNDTSKLRNILKIHHNKPIAKNAKHDFLISEVKKIVETNPNSFIRIIQDSDFPMRCFIEDAIEVGAVIRVGRNKYSIAGQPDDVYTIKQIIDELDPSGINNDVYIKIKSQIENSK
jgi:hypothetical protein